jgi:adenosine deaminase
VTYPKIELHVHLEGTVRPETLLEIARRNDYELPADTVEGLAPLYDYRDFAHFIEVWILTTNALRTRDDFRRVVVDYAEEAAGFGAVYLEAIFSPAERISRGISWDEIFGGYCDGAEEARERHGIEIRLTPDIYRGLSLEGAIELVRVAARYRDRGVPSLERHPLRELAAAGVRRSVSTDDPAMFDTDLGREYEAASLGVEPRRAYENGVAGALCDDTTRERLRSIGESFDWRSLP